MVSAPDTPAHDPEALTPAQADALFAIIRAEGSLIQAVGAQGLSAADFLALVEHPAALRAMESLREIAALRRELRTDSIREELVLILRDVARKSPTPAAQRRAATTALSALDGPPRRRAARTSPRGSTVHTPGSTPRDRRPRAFHRHTAPPAAAAGVGGENPSGVHRPSGATGMSAAADDWSAVAAGDGAEPVVRVETGTAPRGAEKAPNSPDETHSDLSPQSSILPDPAGTLAIAHHVLDTVATDPHAYPPDAIDAARAYVQFCEQQTEHPARPP